MRTITQHSNGQFKQCRVLKESEWDNLYRNGVLKFSNGMRCYSKIHEQLYHNSNVTKEIVKNTLGCKEFRRKMVNVDVREIDPEPFESLGNIDEPDKIPVQGIDTLSSKRRRGSVDSGFGSSTFVEPDLGHDESKFVHLKLGQGNFVCYLIPKFAPGNVQTIKLGTSLNDEEKEFCDVQIEDTDVVYIVSYHTPALGEVLTDTNLNIQNASIPQKINVFRLDLQTTKIALETSQKIEKDQYVLYKIHLRSHTTTML